MRPIDCAFISELSGGFIFSFNFSLAIITVFHYLIVFWFNSHTIGRTSILVQVVIIFVSRLPLSSYDSSEMTAEAFVITNKTLTNFLIFVCSLLSLRVTWYSSESELPLIFKALRRWLIVHRHRLNFRFVSEARSTSIYVFSRKAKSEEFCPRGVLEVASLKPWTDPGSETNCVCWNHHVVLLSDFHLKTEKDWASKTLRFINLSLCTMSVLGSQTTCLSF